MGPNALFSFDQFIYMIIFYPLFTFLRLPCSSSTEINNRAAGHRAVVMVFAEPLRQLNRDGANPAHLSGLFRQDNSIWTGKLASIYLDFAKTHANPDTDGNFPYHRAVVKHLNKTTIDINESTIKKYVESLRPDNPGIRSQLDFGYSYDGQVALLYEVRPDWSNPKELRQIEFVKIRFYKSKQEWNLYWMRASGKMGTLRPVS